MASISKRTNKDGSISYKAQVFVRGHRKSKSFPTKRAAVEWSRQYEYSYKPTASDNITLRDVMIRYLDQITPTKRGAKIEAGKIRNLLKNYPELFDKQMQQLSRKDISHWRDQRLNEVSSSTALREWSILSNAINVAIKDWEWAAYNPFSTVKSPTAAPPRERLIQWREIKALFRRAKYNRNAKCEMVMQRAVAAFVFSLETAMRAQEICNLTWEDIDGRVASINTSKTRSGVRKVPLSKRAMAVLNQMRPLGYHTVFGITTTQLDSSFGKLKRGLGNPDYTFHDTRAAAITRLSKKLDITDLARMVGHKDLSMLMVYYRKSAEDLADKLD